jgi:Raf kinase inhibitor-like YbhB/YbcL family protein
MKITSPAFDHNAFIPVKYGCDGVNVNPPLEISEVPDNTQSLALVVDDPDAPRGDWVHWLMWNIDPGVTKVGEDSIPAGATEGLTTYGTSGYRGPCPPSGIHHYHFTLIALDSKLQLDARSDKAKLEAAMKPHLLARAELIGLYRRS